MEAFQNSPGLFPDDIRIIGRGTFKVDESQRAVKCLTDAMAKELLCVIM
jgi:hypothetical protein